MASSYSTKFRFELIGNGEQSGTWGATTNGTLGTLIEQALAGVGAIVFATDADHTLTTSNGSSDEHRNAIYACTSTGSLTATRGLILPAGTGVTKIAIVANATTGGQSILVKPSGGTGVTVANGCVAQIWSDGSTCYQVGVQVNLSTGAISLGPTTITGNATISGTFGVTGNFSVNTSKLTVDASTGNTAIAGTLGVTGVLSVAASGAAATPAVRVGPEQSGLYYSTAGYLHVAAAGVVVASFHNNGDFTAVGNVYFSSDRRLKQKLRPVRDPLQKLEQLHAYYFEKKKQRGVVQMGLMAQDAQAADATLAAEGPDGFLQLNVGGVLSLAVEGINALKARIAKLEAQRG